MDAVEEIKITCPFQISNPGRPAQSSSLYRMRYGPERGEVAAEVKHSAATQVSSLIPRAQNEVARKRTSNGAKPLGLPVSRNQSVH
jgi:hypothetical protein